MSGRVEFVSPDVACSGLYILVGKVILFSKVHENMDYSKSKTKGCLNGRVMLIL